MTAVKELAATAGRRREKLQGQQEVTGAWRPLEDLLQRGDLDDNTMCTFKLFIFSLVTKILCIHVPAEGTIVVFFVQDRCAPIAFSLG